MKYLCVQKQALSILSLCQVAGTFAFAPYANIGIVENQKIKLSSTRTSDEDGIKIDITHAHECADNFGKCSVDEMEAMKDALHRERVQQTFALEKRIDPVEALDHQLLEEELSLQLDLLKDKLNPVSFHEDLFITPTPILDTEKYEHDLMDFKTDNFESAESKTVSPATSKTEASGTMNTGPSTMDKDESSLLSFMRQKEDLFLMPNGLSESLGIVIAISVVFILDIVRNYLLSLHG